MSNDTGTLEIVLSACMNVIADAIHGDITEEEYEQGMNDIKEYLDSDSCDVQFERMHDTVYK